jgi:hypothetical protein
LYQEYESANQIFERIKPAVVGTDLEIKTPEAGRFPGIDTLGTCRKASLLCPDPARRFTGREIGCSAGG